MAFCAGVRLSPWNELFAKLKNMLPLNMLPPCLLMTFNCGPPVTASPRAPLSVTLISSRVADLRRIARHAHPLVAGALSVHLDLPLVPAAAVDLEHAEDGARGSPTSLPCTLIAGTSAVKLKYCRPDGISATVSPLNVCSVPRARHVHDRRFAADRDRLRHGANFQILVHGRDERAGQHDAFTLDRANPCSVNVTV